MNKRLLMIVIARSESMSLNEVYDVFNEQMVRIGEASRQTVHAQGLWHQTFHCWVVSKTKGEWQLLFQLRHKDKDTYPNLLDISCAGHLLKGESVEDGVRELQEELGLTVNFQDLIYCGVTAEESIISKTLIDREFHHVFIYKCDKPLNEFAFQKSEISGLYTINLIEFKQLLKGEIDYIAAEGIFFDELEVTIHTETRKIFRESITPYSAEYYNLLFNKINEDDQK
jgi:isopentenyldiphosphate isomerase